MCVAARRLLLCVCGGGGVVAACSQHGHELSSVWGGLLYGRCCEVVVLRRVGVKTKRFRAILE